VRSLPYTAVLSSTPPGLISDCVPLLVGITGHRELPPADEPSLRDALRSVLDEIVQSAPHTRVVVLSTLASGSGLLGAEVALDAGLPVVACIPAERDAYERDFTEPELPRFRRALEGCAHVVVVAHPDADAGGLAATAWHLTFHSHILVALWDGSPPRAGTRTSDVVRLRETGLVAATAALEPTMRRNPDPMPVFQIVTARIGSERPADLFSVQRRYPRRFSGDNRAQKDFDASIERLDAYNEDLAAIGAALPQDPAGLAGLMARTDRTANRLQRRALYQLRTLYGLSLLAIAAQLGFGDKLGPEPVKIATLAAAFVAYRIARSKNLENRYQDYRAVSEGLRVQVAWNAVGAGEYVDPYYMRMQQSELQWIRMALRSAAWIESLAPQPRNDRLAMDWVRQQWRYYYYASRRDQRSAGVYRRIGKFSQVIGVVVMVVAALLLLPAFRRVPGETALSAKHWATAFAALVGATAALFGSYADKRGYSANSKRYDRMFGVFDHALRQLHMLARGGADQAPAIRDVGREALVEQAEWLLARRDRPLRVVGR
jgi:hypothetical protein